MKGIPFAPPIGPALPFSWSALSTFQAGIADYTGGQQVKYNTAVYKQGMTPSVDYFLHSGTGGINQTGPQD